jgi:hypothetical protein
MRIAILGAGNTGTCAALELAGRGLRVDLYDEDDEPVRRASFHNEGKVHLGLLYAKDRTLRTAALMIRGALAFAPLLDRWIGFDRDRIAVSTPFYYGVHVGTMVDVEGLKAHYARCQRLFAEVQARAGASYLGLDRTIGVDELPRAEMASLVSTEHFVTMFRTSERAVDPRTVAALLRGAALAHPRVQFVGRARVTGVSSRGRGRLAVAFQKDGHGHVEHYDRVANTLWHGRLEIDASMGLCPEQPWLYRYKFAHRVFVPLTAERVPSITGVLGPFGDIVNYLGNGLFVSWYPTGMIATSQAVRPPEWDRELTVERRREVFRISFAEWRRRCPALESLEFGEAAVDPGGGVIFAWGDTDVADPRSQLHQRHEIGVRSVGHYHSVNTGKFTMSPFLGLRTAERVRGVA